MLHKLCMLMQVWEVTSVFFFDCYSVWFLCCVASAVIWLFELGVPWTLGHLQRQIDDDCARNDGYMSQRPKEPTVNNIHNEFAAALEARRYAGGWDNYCSCHHLIHKNINDMTICKQVR